MRRHIHTAQIQPSSTASSRPSTTAKSTLQRGERAHAERHARHDADPRGVPDDARAIRRSTSASRSEIRDEKKCAEWAVAEASEEIVALFGPRDAGERDAYIVERRHDVEFVCDRLLRALVGEARSTRSAPRRADDRRRARSLARRHGEHGARAGARFVTERRHAHEPHVDHGARARDPRASSASADALAQIRTGDIARSSTACAAQVIVHPDASSRSEDARAALGAAPRVRAAASSRRATSPCVTADGVPVSAQGERRAPRRGDPRASITAPQGIGLYRTEFLYIDRTTQPDEDEQYEVYRAIVEAVQPAAGHAAHLRHRRRQVREHVPAARRDEPGARPARGAPRALAARRCSSTQLRAMVRASAHGDVRIMVPMVASVHEMREVRSLLAPARREQVTRARPGAARSTSRSA